MPARARAGAAFHCTAAVGVLAGVRIPVPMESPSNVMAACMADWSAADILWQQIRNRSHDGLSGVCQVDSVRHCRGEAGHQAGEQAIVALTRGRILT